MFTLEKVTELVKLVDPHEIDIEVVNLVSLYLAMLHLSIAPEDDRSAEKAIHANRELVTQIRDVMLAWSKLFRDNPTVSEETEGFISSIIETYDQATHADDRLDQLSDVYPFLAHGYFLIERLQVGSHDGQPPPPYRNISNSLMPLRQDVTRLSSSSPLPLPAVQTFLVLDRSTLFHMPT